MEVPNVLEEMWSFSAGAGDPVEDDGLCLLGPVSAVATWREQLRFVEEEGPFDEEYVHRECHHKVFDRRWIPFATESSGDDLFCLDGYPSEVGRMHQVIRVHYLEGLHECCATDLMSFLSSYEN